MKDKFFAEQDGDAFRVVRRYNTKHSIIEGVCVCSTKHRAEWIARRLNRLGRIEAAEREEGGGGMTVDAESLAEEVRKIAGRPTIGKLARGFLETAADGLVQLEAENARLRALLENTAYSGLDLLSEIEYLDTKGHFEKCCKALDALKGKEATK